MKPLFDAALDLLNQTRPQWASDNTLVFMGEALANLNTGECAVLTNRFDLAEQIKANKKPVAFSDFALADAQSLLPQPTQIVMRLDKEKALTHHQFNLAAQLLYTNHVCTPEQPATPGAQLWLVGHKNEGLKTYLKKLAKLIKGEHVVHKGKEGYQCIQISVESIDLDQQLDDSNYGELRTIATEPMALLSKPGQYGHKKIDAGSKLLIERVLQDYKSAPDHRFLDLGCGYGYLACMASSLPYEEIIATDNNAASVASTQANFDALGINGTVVATDCARGLEGRFNLLLCNPPFHTGFSHDQQLTTKFAQTISSRLRRKGKAYIVVNQFIAIEPLLQNQGLTVTEVDQDQGYRVFLAHR